MYRCATLLFFLFLFLFLFLPAALHAQSDLVWGEQQRFVDPNGSPGDGLGMSVSLDGDLAVIGTSGYDDPAFHPGAAFVLERRNGVWSGAALLVPSDGDGGQYFGNSVSISGSTILIGAHGGGDWPDLLGAAYVFVHDGTGWIEQAKLEASDGGASDWFGDAVALDGDIAVMGSPMASYPAGRAGAAYVFTRHGTTWTQEAKLAPPVPIAFDRFGWSVAVSGDTVIVGATGDDGPYFESGAAYVYVRIGTTWHLQRKLKPTDFTAASFGYAVAIDGDTALITRGDVATESGAGHVFVRTGTSWTERATLLPGASEPLDWFRAAASLSGNTAVIGAPDQDWLDQRPGTAYVFEQRGGHWSEVAQLRASDAVTEDRFGLAVAVDGATLLVGAPGADDPHLGDGLGTVHVFVPQPAAAATFRNAGTNPASYFVANLPVLGETFWAWIDLQGTTGHPLAWLVGYAQPLTVVLGGGQTLLVDPASPSGELLGLVPLTGLGVGYDIPVPNEVALVGLTLSTQAVHGAGGMPFALSNAQDLVLGR